MKINYILFILMVSLAISCGENKQEMAEKKEKERIHLEKIEVGKSLRKTSLTDELERF